MMVVASSQSTQSDRQSCSCSCSTEVEDHLSVVNDSLVEQDQFSVPDSGVSPQEDIIETSVTCLTVTDVSVLPSSVCISLSRRSPKRGVLRAVSSITITDVEMLEAGISKIRTGAETPLTVFGTITPIPGDQSPNAPLRSPSGNRNKASVQHPIHPRRGNNTRRRAPAPADLDFPARDCTYKGDDMLYSSLLTCKPPFSLEETRIFTPMDDSNANAGDMKRRKSFDILPNVPQRVSSHPNLEDLDGDDDAVDEPVNDWNAKVQCLVETSQCPLDLEDNGIDDQSPRGPLPDRRRCQSFDLLPNIPRRHSPEDRPFSSERFEGIFVTEPIDRFSSETSPPDSMLLKRHQSLDQMILPSRAGASVSHSVIAMDQDRCAGSPQPPYVDQDLEEEEGSPFRVREFLVSLDFMEDKKGRADVQNRKKSNDALPTPPRRFMDEYGALFLDIDDDAPHDALVGNITSTTFKTSLDDVPSPPRRPSYEAMLLNNVVDLVYDIDCSHRTDIHRNSDDDKPVRRKSFDLLPSLPRRRFASDSSYGSDLSPVPLKAIGDSLPSVPRRSGSGPLLSAMLSDHVKPDEVPTTSYSYKNDDFISVLGVKPEQQQYQPLFYDRVPSLPLREFSLHNIDLDQSLSSELKIEDEGQSNDSGLDLTGDLETDDGHEDLAEQVEISEFISVSTPGYEGVPRDEGTENRDQAADKAATFECSRPVCEDHPGVSCDEKTAGGDPAEAATPDCPYHSSIPGDEEAKCAHQDMTTSSFGCTSEPVMPCETGNDYRDQAKEEEAALVTASHDYISISPHPEMSSSALSLQDFDGTDSQTETDSLDEKKAPKCLVEKRKNKSNFLVRLFGARN